MATLTLEISDELKQYIVRLAAEQGVSPEDLVRMYFAGRRFVDTLDNTHETLGPKAREKGFRTDQDVFDAIS